MATIHLNAGPQAQAGEQLKTALAVYREMLDTFVSNRMQRAAAEAGQVHPRQRTPSQPTKAQ